MVEQKTGDLFRVFVFYPDETYFEPEDKRYLAEAAVNKAMEMITKGSDARGEYAKIRITDPDDYCCFEWQKGKGVIFPPQSAT